MTEALTELIVEPGEERQLTARLHHFSGINIKRGGRLIIAPRSARWSIWWVTGDVIIDGAVIGREFARSEEPISDPTPDGKTVSHRFENAAEGGSGGSGGAASGGGSSQGGSGARGTSDYGGGGGSPGGVHIQGPSTHIGSAGQAATDWRGAEPAADGGYSRRGGDGARLGRHPNGALLLVYASGRFSGGGVFEFSGHDGEAGKDGSPGVTSNRGYAGGGGGGGGAPGGDGGGLIIVADQIDNNTTFHAAGGTGGPGGQPGLAKYGTTAGTAGENGYAGTLDEIPLADWTLATTAPRPRR